MIAAWAQEQAKVICNWPEMPPEIQDRDADVWEPLLAVADLAGGDSAENADREAAVALVADSKDGEPTWACGYWET